MQQVGRALRTAPGKRDALVLDYAGLVRMHGPVDIVTARTAAAVRGREDEARAKPCPGCGALIALNASTCEACWVEPEADGEAVHGAEAEDALPILSDQLPEALRPVWHPVPDWRLEPARRARHRLRLPGGRDPHPAAPRGARLPARQGRAMVAGARRRGETPMMAAEIVARQDELLRPSAVRVRALRVAEQVECRLPDGRTFTDLRRPA